VNTATIEGHSILNLDDSLRGHLFRAQTVYAYGSSVVTAIGLSPYWDLKLHDSSTATVGKAGIGQILQGGGLYTDGSSTLRFIQGEASTLTAAGNSTVIVDSINLHGTAPSVGLITRDYSNVTLHGVSSPGYGLLANFGGFSTVSLDSGYLLSMTVHNSANVTWSGSFTEPRFGTRSISVSDNGTLTIYGKDFNYAYGRLPVDTGTLTGEFADGTPFHVTFSGGEGIILAPVPAPPGFVLALTGALCLGGYGWLRRRVALG
jgi:hypothetical protein